jgi:hypothetical protein
VGEAMDKVWRGVLITWPSVGKRSVLAVNTLVLRVSEEHCVMETRVSSGKVDRLYSANTYNVLRNLRYLEIIQEVKAHWKRTSASLCLMYTIVNPIYSEGTA